MRCYHEHKSFELLFRKINISNVFNGKGIGFEMKTKPILLKRRSTETEDAAAALYFLKSNILTHNVFISLLVKSVIA